METFYSNTSIEKGRLLTVEDTCEVHHAYSSLRIKAGEKVSIINGTGVKYKAEVIECTKKVLSLMPLVKIENDTEYENIKLTVAVSLLNKNSKMKLLIEKLTELGIYRFIPFISERTVFPKMNTESLKPSMVSALKQCGGVNSVILSETMTLKELTELKDIDLKYFSDISGQINEKDLEKKSVLAVVGPEGGLTESEKELLSEKGFIKLRLNKRILRAETAAIVTASKFLF